MSFPLALCLAALVLNGLALSLAVLGIQWGAAPPRPEALPLAFLYAHLGLAASTCLLWPAWALRPAAPRVLPWDLAALLVAAIPAVGLSAWISECPAPILLRALGYQAGLALFVLGVLSWAHGSDLRAALATGFLAALCLGLPMLVYLQAEFLPALAGTWWPLAPPLALHALAHNLLPGAVWWLALALGGAGLLLRASTRRTTLR